MNLTDIANKHFTDKGTLAFEAHGYTEEYSKYIPSTGVYNLLEIGVWKCDSMRMWAEYNPEMNIYGIDNDSQIFNHYRAGDTFPVYIGDQSDEKFLNYVVNDINSRSNKDEEQPLDFVIDDGSHRYEDILASFKALYPKVKPGGYYFIEDLHAQQARKQELVHEVLKYLNKDFKLEWLCNTKLLVIKKVDKYGLYVAGIDPYKNENTSNHQ